MTTEEGAGGALFRGPVPEGFASGVVLVAVSRGQPRATDEFSREAGSYGDD